MKIHNTPFAILFLCITIPFFCSCGKKGNPKYVAELEKKGVVYRHTDFHDWVKKGDIETVELFLKAGMDIDVIEYYRSRSGRHSGMSALMVASLEGNLEMAKFLVEQGAEVNLRNRYGVSAVHKAARYGHMPVVEFLVGKGAALDQAPEVIIWTAENGHGKMVKYLVEHGIPVNTVGEEAGRTALLQAAWKDHTETVGYLIDQGADLNAISRVHSGTVGGRTALIYATENGNAEMAGLLIAAGTDLNIKDKFKGRTALIHAIEAKHPEVAWILIEKGADVNTSEDEWGWTPLMFAAHTGQLETVEQLLSAGADRGTKDVDGQTAIVLAEKMGHDEVAKVLNLTR